MVTTWKAKIARTNDIDVAVCSLNNYYCRNSTATRQNKESLLRGKVDCRLQNGGPDEEKLESGVDVERTAEWLQDQGSV